MQEVGVWDWSNCIDFLEIILILFWFSQDRKLKDAVLVQAERGYFAKAFPMSR